MYQRFIKRFIDIVLSLVGLIVLAIPMLVFALIVKLDSPGPVLFWQKRVGIHKKTFMMPKFRTMYTDTPANMPTHLLSDPQKWITRSGAWFRKQKKKPSFPEPASIWSVIPTSLNPKTKRYTFCIWAGS